MSKTFLEALTSVGKNLQSGINQLKKTNVGYINVKQLGAVGDGVSDDSEYFQSDALGFIVNDGTFALSKEKFGEVIQKPIVGNGKLALTGWSESGIPTASVGLLKNELPIDKLYNKLYCSNHLPADDSTVMGRPYGRISFRSNVVYDYPVSRALPIAAVYPTLVQTISTETVSVKIGKLCLFAYSKIKKCWVKLSSYYVRTTDHVKVYNIVNGAWDGTYTEPESVIFDYETNQATVVVSKNNLLNGCIHFWGEFADIDPEEYTNFIHIFTISIDDDNINQCVVANAVDLYTTKNTIHQAYYSRNVFLTNAKQLCVGHCIPDDEFDITTDEEEIYKMYYQDEADNCNMIRSYDYLIPAHNSNYQDDILFMSTNVSDYDRVYRVKLTAISSYADEYEVMVLAKASLTNKIYPKTVHSYSTWNQTSKFENAFKVVENEDGTLSFYVSKTEAIAILHVDVYCLDTFEMHSKGLFNLKRSVSAYATTHNACESTDLTNVTLLKQF